MGRETTCICALPECGPRVGGSERCASCISTGCTGEPGRKPTEVHRPCGGGEVGAHGGPDDRHCLVCTDPACRYNQPDAGRMPTPTACAGCGHVAKHHTRRDSVYAGLMADYRVVWRCAWKGCGCPEFMKVKP